MKLKITLALLLLVGYVKAQMPIPPSKYNLEKRVSIEAKDQQLSEVLNKISKAGNFYFSYSGSLFKRDSLVNLSVKNAAVREVLDKLFNHKVDYTENGEYIILRYAANHLTIEPENITTAEKLYLISGYVIDIETGHKVKQASVYEKRLLQSTLTDNEGYFRLKFKGEHQEVILTASKESYRDTTLIFLSDIKIKPEGYNDPDANKANGRFGDIENSGLGRFFITSRQKIQSLNIPNFFANTPFQASLTPGLSSHGIMSSQVINKLSINVLGGYTAGTNGFEMAGLFNITKGDVKKLQFAGLFNQVGGSVTGIQMAGLVNDVRGKTKGLQAAGLVNNVKADAAGFQLAGILNLAAKNMKGTQSAGILNLVSKDFDGFQLAGIGNIGAKHVKGVQIAGIFNYAKKMDGFQFGLINVADTSSGYSLGLINFIKNGYHKISLYTNEITNVNVSLKTGNAKLYTILFAGLNLSNQEKIYTAGIGVGHDFILNKRIAIGLEMTGQYLYLGDWNADNLLNRFQSNIQFQLFKGLTVFGGPTYAIYTGNQHLNPSAPGYKQNIVPSHHTNLGGSTKGWLGFNAGITIM
ncbi:carboxypeptidase-like regulatory domain-containing protein [Pedobacter hiemivivus]|uniref:Carboxypeptidase-like regulatory domain-containing protein n=1 Tax=Pedobacter hiemivivus TaxID=2530454 RepID=A0A4U1G6P6_9SPHI|nr:carboxypeptidase-like regulatory domain-containing protein [Pedobacter hiemivivus]TKC59298.1 carboxypeptidase-like regulatory domain-containing protein [Pedobacter hiemivivus]